MENRFVPSWYAACLRDELSAGKPHASQFCGQNLILGLNSAGTLQATLDGQPPVTCERDGVVFVWFGSAEPTFDLPMLESTGFTRSSADVIQSRTQASFVMRDLADYGHFESIHEYQQLQIEKPFSSTGADCSLTFSFDWPLIPGVSLLTTRARAVSECCGMGYQLTTVTSVGGAMVSRHRVLPTPLDDKLVRIALLMEVRTAGPLALLPGVDRIAHNFTRWAYRRDIARDAAGWDTLAPDAKEKTQEPLASYWSWVQQLPGEAR